MSLRAGAQGLFEGNHVISPGEWIIDVTSFAGGKIIFQETVRLYIRGGVI